MKKEYYEITYKEHLHLLKWVCKALRKTEDRFQLMALHVTNKAIVATDGSRMHVWEVTPQETLIDPGNYRIALKESKRILLEPLDHNYPKWEKAVPDKNDMQSSRIHVCADCRAWVPMKAGIPLNDSFVKDALSLDLFGKFKDAHFTIWTKGELSPVRIEFDQHKAYAIIMPMRLRD